MGLFRKILVAVDGSETSTNALKQSFRFLNDETEITVLSVSPYVKVYNPLTEVDDVNAILKGIAAKVIADANDTARAEGVSITSRMEEGEIYSAIIETAKDAGCDLVVMGRRGMSRIERALLGSETDRVIGHNKGLTLVVPKDSSLGLDNILVATDGSQYSDNALDEAMRIARHSKATLHIVNAVYIPDDFESYAPDASDKLIDKANIYLDELKNEALRSNVSAEVHAMKGRPSNVIVSLAQELKAGLIIMGSHGRTGLKKLFMGSVTSRVIGHSTCPVMVVNK